jgi:hypothetical protein
MATPPAAWCRPMGRTYPENLFFAVAHDVFGQRRSRFRFMRRSAG